MITLNGKQFAKNDKEFTDSLFTSGGTCHGYYKVYKNKVMFYDMQMNPIAAISNNVLSRATKQDDNKIWYSYGTPNIIGDHKSYRAMCNEVSSIMDTYNLPVKH